MSDYESLRADLEEELALETEMAKRLSTRWMDLFAPNPRQWDFCSAGGPTSYPKAHEILLSGPNQVGGKTYTIDYLMSIHATGLYPDEWEGPRFKKPPHLAAAGETAQATRDQICDKLFGMAPNYGEGWIPQQCYDPKTDLVSLRGNADHLLDYALVDWHDENGVVQGKTVLRFFGYAKGWRRIQGYTLDGIFLNEMPADDIYNEMRARINATLGYIWIAACPLLGDTETYLLFERDETGLMCLLNYTIDDCTHLTQEEYDFNMLRWKDHPEAEARLYGRPCRGAGMIYAYPRRMMIEPTFHAQPHLPQIIGLDLPHGTGTFAAVKLVIEPERDMVHVVDEFKASNQETPVYVDRVRMMGGTVVPVAWPHDGGRGFGSTTSGGTIAEKYRSMGLRMLKDPAFVYDHENRKSRSIMTAIEMVQDRLATGRLKISQNCRELLEEMRIYRHEKGLVKPNQDDHLIDALHKAMMMLRYAKAPAHGAQKGFEVYTTPQARGDYEFF
jgi:phage terminase large subunit-like protein